jgi:hypothetical protein
MKKLLLLGVVLGSFLTAKAQETAFTVDFSDLEVLTDWYLINADGDDFGWGVNTDALTAAEDQGFTGGFGFSASYDNATGPLTPDNSLITQAFAIPAGSDATLTYKVGGLDPDYYSEHYAVYVLTDEAFTTVFADIEAGTATVEDFTALLVNPLLEETLDAVTATDKTVTISGYAGQSVRVIFRHYDVTDQYYLLLDDVTVTTQLGVNSVLASKFSVYPNPVANFVNLTNDSNISINSVQIADLNGRIIKTVNTSAVATAQINVSDLSSGMYMMTVNTDQGSMTKKIVKN